MSSNNQEEPVATIKVKVVSNTTDGTSPNNDKPTSQEALSGPQTNTESEPEASSSIPPPLLVPFNRATIKQPFCAVLMNVTGSDGTKKQVIHLKEVTASNSDMTRHPNNCSQTSETQHSTSEENLSSSSSQGSGESIKSKDTLNESPSQISSDSDLSAAKRIRMERQISPSPYTAKTERAKQYNLYIRQLVDSHLDKRVPISLQPREQIQEIIEQASSEFPDFAECTRKRIQTYLKTCRRSKPKNEASQICDTPALPFDQRVPSTISSNALSSPSVSCCVSNGTGMTNRFTEDDYTSVRQLIQGYKQSATFLIKAAAELEQLLPPSSLSPLL